MTIGICNNSRVSPTAKQRLSGVSGDNEGAWIGEARSPPETVDGFGDQAVSTAMSAASATASTSTPPRSPAASSATGSVVDPVDSAVDDEDGEPEGDPDDAPSSEPTHAEDEPRERASTTSPAASTSAGGTPPPAQPSEQLASTATSAAPPRVRLKANLATDPALRAEPAISPVLLPTGAALDFLAALPPAFHSVLAGRLFLPPVGTVAPLVGAGAPPPPPQAQSSQPQAQTSQSQDGAEPRQGFRCEPCGIRYSSPRTLAAHQRFYCSHRQSGPASKGIVVDSEEPAKAAAPTNAVPATAPAAVSLSTSVPSASQSTNSAASAADLIAEVPPGRSESAESDPANRRPKQYSCPHCSYSADKKVSLNRHMRMHSASPPITTATPTVATAPVAAAPADDADDTYCVKCDIRFSSQKTYRAHKTNYCRTRHILKADVVADASPPLTAPPLETAAAPPLLALPTSPVLLVPYSLIQGASLLPATQYRGRAAPDTACLLLPDGSLRPVATALPIGGAAARPPKPPTQPNSAGSSSQGHVSPPEPTTRRKSATGGPTSAPLDLSVRRGPGDTDDEDKMDDHEDIVCAPSIPLLLSAASSPLPSPAPPGAGSGQPSPPPETPPPSRKRPHSEDGSGGATSPVLTSRKSPRRTPNGVKPDGQYSPEPEMNAAAVNAAAAALTAAAVASYPPELLAQFASMDPKELQLFLTSRSALPLLLQNPPGFQLVRMPGELPPPIPPPPSPQVLVKRGVSKCNECNIVFCKHETYLAHKKNYCSARLSGDDAGTSRDHAISPVASPPPAAVPAAAAATPPLSDGRPSSPANHPSKPILEQYICMACNIRYSSRDTLHAHQTFYCRKRIGATADPKLIEIDKAKRRCGKCKVAVPVEKWSSHHCDDTGATVSVVSAPAPSGWRCPCCPVNSPTAAAAQRHMETHSSVRAFRCTLCGYKGNTLRGMRTHIRVHLVNKGISDPTEENYITCVLEDDSGSAPSISAPSTVPSPGPARTLSPEAIPHPEEVYVEERKFSVYDRKGGKSIPTVRPPNPNEHSETACNGFDCSIKQERDKSSDEEMVTVDEFKVKMEPMDTRQGSPDPQRSPSPDGRLSVEPKEELNGTSEVLTGNNNQKTELQYCKSCHLSFNYYSTFVQHKKMHCENHQAEGTSGSHKESVRTRPEASAL